MSESEERREHYIRLVCGSYELGFMELDELEAQLDLIFRGELPQPFIYPEDSLFLAQILGATFK